jgi:hypothetical protein
MNVEQQHQSGFMMLAPTTNHEDDKVNKISDIDQQSTRERRRSHLINQAARTRKQEKSAKTICSKLR